MGIGSLKHTGQMQAVIYSRVSTQTQDTQRQIADLTQWAEANGYTVAQVFQDVQSGKTKAAARAGAAAMFNYLQQGTTDIVLCSEISRLGRSTIDVQNNINKIVHKMGIALHIHQQGLTSHTADGQINTTFKLITDVLANVAQMEREQIADRVRSGLRNARANGKTLGRPKGATQTDAQLLQKYAHVAKELRSGLSLRKTAKLCDVSVNTVRKVQQALTDSK